MADSLLPAPTTTTKDTRVLSELSPLVTLQELHCKLWISSTAGKEQPATAVSSSFPGRKGKFSRQSSARSARSSVNGVNGPAAAAAQQQQSRPATALSSGTKLELPSYVNPLLWSAALQQGHAGTSASTPQHPKVSAVLDLQDSVLLQIQEYKQLAPALEAHKQQHPYLRPVRKLPPSDLTAQPDTLPPAAATAQAAAASTTQPTTSSKPTLSAPCATTTAAAAAPAAQPPVAPLPLQQLASLTGRLEAACQQVVDEIPLLLTPASIPGVNDPPSGMQTRRVQHHTKVQLYSHRSYAGGAGAGGGGGKTARGLASFSCGRQQQQLAAGSLQPPPPLQVHELHAQPVLNSSTTPGSCKSQWAAAVHASQCGSLKTSHSAAGGPQQQQQQDEAGVQLVHVQLQLQPPSYTNIPFKLQHLRKAVVVQEGAAATGEDDGCNSGSSSSSHIANINSSSSSPNSPTSRNTQRGAGHAHTDTGRSRRSRSSSPCRGRGRSTTKEAPSPLAALQAQLPADAVAALQAATAASVEQQLQRYHAHMLDAQQQLLARECGSDTQHGSQVCQVTGGSSLAPAGVSCAGAAVGGSAGSGLGAAAATGDSKSAEFTMQQLVARLAKRDVQREDTTKGTEGPSEQPGSGSATSAVNQRVAAASTLPELLAAANEHLRLAAHQGSGLKLDIGRIARLHKMTRTWKTSSADASARSRTSSSSAVGGHGGGGGGDGSNSSSAANTARPDQGGAAAGGGGVGGCGSSSSSLQSSREVATSRPVVPRPIIPSAPARPAAGVARASIVSTSVSCGSDSTAAAAQNRRGSNTEASCSQQHLVQAAEAAAAVTVTAATEGAGAPRRRTSLFASGSTQQASTAHQVASTGSLLPAAASAAWSSSISSSCMAPPPPDAPTATTSSSRASANDCSGISNNSSRLPPPMKVAPPQLHPPSAAEVAALPMPSLPLLLDLSHEPVKVLEARLQRVWEALGVPAEQQLDMVLRYTSRSAAAQFEDVLEVWETAAAAVLQRESLLEHVLQLQAAIAHLSQQEAVQHVCTSWVQQQGGSIAFSSSGNTRAGEEAGVGAGLLHPQLYSEPSQLFGLTLPMVRQVLWAYQAATHQVQLAAQGLYEATGQLLLVDGCEYPPSETVVEGQQLQQLLIDAWRLLGSAGV